MSNKENPLPNFDETRLIEWVRKYSFPRLVGSSGEKKALRMCNEEFSKLGYTPIEEPFKFSRFFANFWVRGSLAMFAVLFIIYLIRDWIPSIESLFRYFLMFLMVYFLFMVIVFRDPTNFRPRNIPSTNIYVKLPAISNSKGIILVSAHYDSKSQRLTIKWRASLAILATILSIAVTILMLIRWITDLGDWEENNVVVLIIRILIVPIIICFVGLAANKIGNNSPGASDNATGMACVFELAKHFKNNPLNRYDLWFVQFGAEEMGTMGSRFFLRNHGKKLRLRRRKGGKRWNSFNINFDMIYSDVKFIQERKMVRKYVYLRLTNALREAMTETGIQAHPWYLGPGASTDRRNFSKKHIEALDICDWTGGEVAHSTRDTPDRINPQLLKKACILVHNVIHKIDQGKLTPRHPYWEKVKGRLEGLQLNREEHQLAREAKRIEKKIDKKLKKPPA